MHKVFMFLFGTALGALPVAASAATVDVLFFGSAGAQNQQSSKTFGSFLGNSFTLDASSGLGVADAGSASDSGNLGSSSSSAQFSVNAKTGQMRLGVQAAVSPSEDGRGEANSTVQLVLTERYLVTGIGQLKVGLEFSAFWDALDFETAGSAYLGQSSAVVQPITLGTEVRYNPSVSGGGGGSVSKQIFEGIYDVFAPDGEFVEVFWQMQGFVGIGGGGPGLPAESAFINALNTSNIFISTTDSLSAVAETSGFLSNQEFDRITPVPLPASVLMLLSGLLGLLGLSSTSKIRLKIVQGKIT